MSKKTLFRVVFVVIILFIFISTLLLVDFNLVIQGGKPRFCLTSITYEDGGSIMYTGLGYKILKYNTLQGKNDIKVGTIFLQYGD